MLIALMEAVSTSETSVNFYQTTRHDIPEDSHLHTHRREDLKSQLIDCFYYPIIVYLTVKHIVISV
jgi:hypothetical protein